MVATKANLAVASWRLASHAGLFGGDMVSEELIKQVKVEEGLRLKQYKCTAGHNKHAKNAE